MANLRWTNREISLIEYHVGRSSEPNFNAALMAAMEACLPLERRKDEKAVVIYKHHGGETYNRLLRAFERPDKPEPKSEPKSEPKPEPKSEPKPETLVPDWEAVYPVEVRNLVGVRAVI
jgi:hypothetical protein